MAGAAAAEEARIAAGPPLGVSVKPGAFEGVDLKKGVFASTEGRWGQVLHDPDYQGDTKLRWINPPWMVGDTESDWVNSEKLSPAVADVSDLVENWPPEPEQEEKPSDQYVELLHREATREATARATEETREATASLRRSMLRQRSARSSSGGGSRRRGLGDSRQSSLVTPRTWVYLRCPRGCCMANLRLQGCCPEPFLTCRLFS